MESKNYEQQLNNIEMKKLSALTDKPDDEDMYFIKSIHPYLKIQSETRYKVFRYVKVYQHSNTVQPIRIIKIIFFRRFLPYIKIQIQHTVPHLHLYGISSILMTHIQAFH